MEEKEWNYTRGFTMSRGTSVSSLFTSVRPPPSTIHNVHQRVSTRSKFMQRSWLRYPRLSVTQAHTCNARTFMRRPPLSYILRVSPLPLEVLLIYFRVNLITRSLAMRRLKLLLFSCLTFVFSSCRSCRLCECLALVIEQKGRGNVTSWKKLDFSLDLRESNLEFARLRGFCNVKEISRNILFKCLNVNFIFTNVSAFLYILRSNVTQLFVFNCEFHLIRL